MTHRGNLTINVLVTDQRRMTVRALDRVGPFAIHRGVTEDGAARDDYTVTHVPTGLAARKWINRRRVARRIARVLLERIDAPWSSEDERVFLRYEREAREAMREVMLWP